jgi:hypothetical protein
VNTDRIIYNKVIFLIIILSGLFCNIGCKKESAEKIEYQPVFVSESSKEFLIPRDMRAAVEKKYLEFIRKENSKIVLTDDAVISSIPREFLDIEVLLNPTANAILREPVKLRLPRGGGVVDLKGLVTGSKGSFYIKFVVQRSNDVKHQVDNLLVYFLSNSKKRKILGEEYGAGCKKFFDISNLVSLKPDDKGIQVNATAQRYLSVIGGTFYFFNFNPDRKIYIGAIDVTDSRYPELMCEEGN